MAVREIQRGYDPAVGFVDRRGVRTYNPIVTDHAATQEQPRAQLRVWTAMEFQTDIENRLLTRILDLRLFRVDFQSGDNFQFNITPTYERLERNFEISRGVTLPNGSIYNFTRYLAQVATATRRVVSGTIRYENGTFYSGHRRDFTLNLGLRPRLACW